MTNTQAEIVAATKAFILREFLPGEKESELTEATPLLSSGILDSISTVQLVGFLEDTYGVEFQAHEISEDHLDTLTSAAKLVIEKQGE
jgi:acyl carrier protein